MSGKSIGESPTPYSDASIRPGDPHCHLFGCIDGEDLAVLAGHSPPQVAWFEERYHAVFGRLPPLRDLLHDLRAGRSVGARFDELLRFDGAAGFDGFQVHADLVAALTAWPWAHRWTGLAARQTAALLGQVAERHARAGLEQVEYRVVLPGRCQPGQLRVLLEALTAACAASSGAGFRATLAVALPRQAPLRRWPAVRDHRLHGRHGAWLQTIDLATDERGQDPGLVLDLLAAWSAFNHDHPSQRLDCTIHIGEVIGDRGAVSLLTDLLALVDAGLRRIGHGLVLGLDPERFLGQQQRIRVDDRCRQLDYLLAHDSGRWSERIGSWRAERERLVDRYPETLLDRRVDEDEVALIADLQVRARQRLREVGAVVECCPTSNCLIAGLRPADHPLPELVADGVAVVVGTDDPGILGTDHAHERDLAAAWTGQAPRRFDQAARRLFAAQPEPEEAGDCHGPGGMPA